MTIAVNTVRDEFLCYKNVSSFDELFYKIVDKLEVIDRVAGRDKAQDMGKILAKRLKEVETDDDWFPYGNIQLICKTVDSFHTNDEL